jgi:hypothetical protein
MCSSALAQKAGPRKATYAVEMKNCIAGYYEESESRETFEGERVLALRIRRFIKMSLLGSPVDVLDEMSLLFREGTTEAVSYRHSNKTGEVVKLIECRFEGRAVKAAVSLNGKVTEQKEVELPEGAVVLTGNWTLVTLAASAGLREKGDKKAVKAFIPAVLRNADATLVFEGDGEIRSLGKTVSARKYSISLPALGVKTLFWIDRDTGTFLRSENADVGMAVYLADETITGKLKRAEATDLLVAQTNVLITDVRKITYMKIEADLMAPGDKLTAGDLNVPNQKFTGTVVDNHVKGVFEITSRRYKGESAPPFPPEFESGGELGKYLLPETAIESDDEEIRKLALRLTEGAENAWDAAVRLAEWVHREIPYEIPGGGTALGTLKKRAGECGGHSRLHTALCRAVGIPARVVSGGMYTPIYGGSFGQHAWDEVFMGSEAGWIPVDTTAGETSFADAGHIRLKNCGFRPKKLTVLDYSPKEEAGGLEASARPVPCELGKSHRYHYAVNGREIGTEEFIVTRKVLSDRAENFVVKTKLAMQGLAASSTAEMTGKGEPVSYKVSGQTAAMDYSIDCAFSPGEVKAKVVKGDFEVERTVKIPAGALLFDNNHIGLFTMMLSRFKLSEGAEIKAKAFHPSSLSVHALVVKVGKSSKVVIRGVEHEALDVKVHIATTVINFSVTPAGLVVKDVESGGRLVVEYQGPK